MPIANQQAKNQSTQKKRGEDFLMKNTYVRALVGTRALQVQLL